MVSYLTLSPLSNDFIRVIHSQCSYALLWIKGMQIGGHEIEIRNFSDNTIIFLRYFSCLTKIELILELCEKLLAQK